MGACDTKTEGLTMLASIVKRIIDFLTRILWTVYYAFYWIGRGFLLLPNLWQLFRLRAPRVTFFGGAKVALTDRYALDARLLAKKCVENGISIITGGGAGIMEAAALGAQDARPRGVRCLGVGVLGFQESVAPVYKTFIRVKHLIERKWLMIHFSQTCVVFPGGVGTYNEFAEVLTLIDMELVRHVPFVLYGKDYWQPILTWVKDVGVKQGFVDKQLINYVVLVDDVDTAFEWIKRACRKK